MTITQVKEINEKIIELTDWIRRYRFEIRCVNLINHVTQQHCFGELGLTITRLEITLQNVINSYFYETKYPTCRADIRYINNERDEYLERAVDNRAEVNDDISLDELSLWIDLFALIYC